MPGSGRSRSHEAVTAISRELMLQAKEVAEDMGYEILHMYVDSLFVQKKGLKEKQDFEPLLQAITEQTKIPIMMEGVYRWVCFPPSRRRCKDLGSQSILWSVDQWRSEVSRDRGSPQGCSFLGEEDSVGSLELPGKSQVVG